MIDESDRAELVRLRAQVADLLAALEQERRTVAQYTSGEKSNEATMQRQQSRIADLLAALEEAHKRLASANDDELQSAAYEVEDILRAAIAAAHQGEGT